jgi:Protein of unknown function (DUF2769)
MTNVPDTLENLKLCICGACPSFPKEGGLYCAPERAKYPVRRRGCICGDCRVFQQYDLQDSYYCDEARKDS